MGIEPNMRILASGFLAFGRIFSRSLLELRFALDEFEKIINPLEQIGVHAVSGAVMMFHHSHQIQEQRSQFVFSHIHSLFARVHSRLHTLGRGAEMGYSVNYFMS